MKNYSAILVKKSLVDELNRIIPFTERQQFVEEMLARELRRRKITNCVEKIISSVEGRRSP
ncbi:MAG: hypothetical protein Fur0017_31230 [Anaerolineales bacterium]